MLLSLIAGALGLVCCVHVGAEPPRLVATRTENPPRIDGRLSESEWQAAFVASSFVLLGSGEPATQATVARVLFDAENLYFGFECFEDRPEEIAALIRDRDGPTYLDDCVEVFLAPDPDPQRYYHFVVNAAGALRDEERQEVSWDSGAVAEAVRLRNGWSAELAVPLADLPITADTGSEWRLNLCREERPHGELSSWASCRSGFHEAARFGWLTGLDINVARYARQQVLVRLRRAIAQLRPALDRALAAPRLRAAKVAVRHGLRARTEFDRARAAVGGKRTDLQSVREAETALEQGLASLRTMQLALPKMNMSLALKQCGQATSYAVCQESSMARVRPDVPYDGQPARKVSVALARGEYEGSQIVVVPIEQDLTGVRVSVSALKGNAGRELSESQVMVNRVGYVNITQPSARSGAPPGIYPDPLLDNEPRDIEQDETGAWLITVHAELDQPPGKYRGRLVVEPDNAPKQEIPFEVRVWDFALPRTPALRTCFRLIPSYLWRVYDLPPAPGVPSGWEFSVWTGADIKGRPNYFGTGVFRSSFETKKPHGSKRALCIQGEVAEPGAVEAPRACYHRVFQVQPNTDYEVTIWYRTDGLSDGRAQIHVHTHGAHLAMPAADSWRQARLRFNSGDKEKARLYLCNHGVGRVYFDDVRLSPVNQPEVNLVDDPSFERGGTYQQRVDLLRAYRLNMLAHRCSDMNVAAPQIEVDEAGEVKINWDEFDREIEYYLKHGLNAFNVYWARVPSGWGKVASIDEKTLRISAEILRQTQAHLEEKGWLDLAYIYTIDEPGKAAFADVKAAFEHVHAAAPKLKRLLTFGYGASRPIRPGNPLYRRLEGFVDIWVPHSDCFEAQYLESRRRAGDEIWEYVCISAQKPYANIWGVDFPGTDPRVVFWQCYAEEITGFLYWAVNYWEKDPWKDPLTYPGGNSDGSLLYYGSQGPVNSLRWETIRDGIEDYDYLVLLESLVRRAEQQGRCRSLCKSAYRLLDVSPVTRSFTDYTTSPKVIESQRTAVARMIERLTSALGE